MATVPLAACDLSGGWMTFPRVKTEVARRCPLWPETMTALKSVIWERPQPKPGCESLLFLNESGGPLIILNEESGKRTDLPINRFVRLKAAAGITTKGAGFYWLRHVCQTVGDQAGDAVAVKSIMGHVDASMSDYYRHRVADSNLRKVTDHIRRWLFPKTAQGNEQVPHRQAGRARSRAGCAIDDLVDVMGRATIEAVLQMSAEQLAGPRQQGKRTDREVVYHGSQNGRVMLHERQLKVTKPQLRRKRREVGVSKSQVSREFIEAGERLLKALAKRDFSETRLLMIYIDGLQFGPYHVICAVGVDEQGHKHVLGFREGATENAEVAKGLLEDLVARGVSPFQRRLFVIDGSKALWKAIDQVFGAEHPVQRCRNHKVRNVLGYLDRRDFERR